MMISLEHQTAWQATKAWLKQMSLAHYVFLLFWVLKPFYLRPSGTMQLSDFVAMAAFGLWVLGRRGLVVERVDFSLIGFVACTFLINGIYFGLLGDSGLLMSSAYYLYNLLIVLMFRDLMTNRPFLKYLLYASAANVLIQLVVLVLGLGSFFWKGFRFMGTFNDPNQYAFSMLTSFLMVYILNSHLRDLYNIRHKWLSIGIFALTLLFIFDGGSTGVLLGIAAFAIVFLIQGILGQKTALGIFVRVIALLMAVAVLAAFFTIDFSKPQLDGSVDSATFLVYRLFEKIGKAEAGGIFALFDDRGLDKLVDHPIYLLIGSGEGAYYRFPASTFEVHSTFPGMFFYYGILPFLLLMAWLWRQLRGMRKPLIAALLSLLTVGLTLANQRQPVFYVIILLLSLNHADTNDLRTYQQPRLRL